MDIKCVTPYVSGTGTYHSRTYVAVARVYIPGTYHSALSRLKFTDRLYLNIDTERSLHFCPPRGHDKSPQCSTYTRTYILVML